MARRTPRGIPIPPLLYTVDQVGSMLSLTTEDLEKSYLWREGIERIPYRDRYLRAVPIRVTVHREAEYRISQDELERWLTLHNLYVFDPDGIDADPVLLAASLSPIEVRPNIPQANPLPPSEDAPDDDLLSF